MTTIRRRSPVTFSARPSATETRNDWVVALEYSNEGDGPHLIDLSHRSRWDLQDKNISDMTPFGVAVPATPGECVLENGILVNRMNGTQAALLHLAGDQPESPEAAAFTETTEATVFLALTGKNVFSITEKLTGLDLADPAKKAPFLIQGPLSHVPCQITVLKRDGNDGVVLLTCSRGYGHNMVHAILGAGEEFGMRPAGESAFLKVLG
ncbi:sarcosine oxidase subunit gamma SoxG [Desulfonema ishimotonii]|uniref:Sarcosine oxidase subunit gamma SoxG n=1 Tax=Desulfonema ishimotonii TaxID=45657 RepID=A0A401FWW6_9BACT|nr:sarcosine oxidase subunit gamma SoxG [Desulfonema ishimotonii]GBC61455.1 sarcosine oxidase subunit gamma SoxG [Desulfonema ishimotonii]